MASPIDEDGGGHSQYISLSAKLTVWGHPIVPPSVLDPYLAFLSEIFVTTWDLDLLRAFLLFTNSSNNMVALITTWVKSPTIQSLS